MQIRLASLKDRSYCVSYSVPVAARYSIRKLCRKTNQRTERGYFVPDIHICGPTCKSRRATNMLINTCGRSATTRGSVSSESRWLADGTWWCATSFTRLAINCDELQTGTLAQGTCTRFRSSRKAYVDVRADVTYRIRLSPEPVPELHRCSVARHRSHQPPRPTLRHPSTRPDGQGREIDSPPERRAACPIITPLVHANTAPESRAIPTSAAASTGQGSGRQAASRHRASLRGRRNGAHESHPVHTALE